MSELQRSFAKAKLAGLPFQPPLPQTTAHGLDGEEGEGDVDDDPRDDLMPPPDRRSTDDDSSSSASSASSASSTGTIKPSPSKHLFARPKGLVIPFYQCFVCGLTVECC